MWTEKEKKEKDIIAAKAEITQAEALKVLLLNNDIAAEIHCCGMIMGTCNNVSRLGDVAEHKTS